MFVSSYKLYNKRVVHSLKTCLQELPNDNLVQQLYFNRLCLNPRNASGDLLHFNSPQITLFSLQFSPRDKSMKYFREEIRDLVKDYIFNPERGNTRWYVQLDPDINSGQASRVASLIVISVLN